MAEYIERKRTVELLRSLGNREYRKEKGTIQDAIKMISYPEYTPTEDVAPVVHCRHCRSYNKPRLGWCSVHLDREGPDDFCSYGCPRDGDDARVD